MAKELLINYCKKVINNIIYLDVSWKKSNFAFSINIKLRCVHLNYKKDT